MLTESSRRDGKQQVPGSAKDTVQKKHGKTPNLLLLLTFPRPQQPQPWGRGLHSLLLGPPALPSPPKVSALWRGPVEAPLLSAWLSGLPSCPQIKLWMSSTVEGDGSKPVTVELRCGCQGSKGPEDSAPFPAQVLRPGEASLCLKERLPLGQRVGQRPGPCA